MGYTIYNAIRWRWLLWLSLIGGLTAFYFLVLMTTLVIRFGVLPNYAIHYDLWQSVNLILSGTPSIRDALSLLAAEPWLEIGYANPDYYGVAEWSLMVVPGKALPVILLNALLATSWVLARPGACRVHHGRYRGLTLAGLGGGVAAISCATVTWVVCCATPTWAVLLAMVGVNASLALALEPLGLLLFSAGCAAVLGTVIWQARRFDKGGERIVNTFDREVTHVNR